MGAIGISCLNFMNTRQLALFGDTEHAVVAGDTNRFTTAFRTFRNFALKCFLLTPLANQSLQEHRRLARAVKLSYAIIDAAIEAAPATAKIALSNSWGKDSSTILNLMLERMIERRAAGLRILPLIVMTADTSSEFPDMAARMESEGQKLQQFAKRVGLDVTYIVSRPDAHQTLYAQYIGGGAPLPKYANVKSVGSASWCVDRVKTAPLNALLATVSKQSDQIIYCIGTRTDESTRRKANMNRHSAGLPFGLTRMALSGGRFGITPISHWDHEHLQAYLKHSFAVWNWNSFELLKDIYRKGAGADDISQVKQCEISTTADGSLTSACSDLSNARFGCFVCWVRNKALSNYADQVSTYRWFRAAHRLIHNGIRDHHSRKADLLRHGFTGDTAFPKNHLFSWRWMLLCLILRGEKESGTTIISAAIEEAIHGWWARSGIFTLTVDDARRDVERWIATKRLRFCWRASAENYETLSPVLIAGLPAGVYAHLLHRQHKQPLAIANLMPLAEMGSPIYPHLKAYVFRDRNRGGFLTMVTDVPSDMGRKLNTLALNGYQGFVLELIGMRDPTPWEIRLGRNNTVYYRSDPKGLQAQIEELIGCTWQFGHRLPDQGSPQVMAANDLVEVETANTNLRDPCGEHAYADHVYNQHFIAGLKGRCNLATFKVALSLATTAAELSDELTDKHAGAYRAVLKEYRAFMGMLGSEKHHAGTKEARDRIRIAIQRLWQPEDTVETFHGYLRVIRAINTLIRSKAINTELIASLANISRHARYDEAYAMLKLGEIIHLLDIQPATPPDATDLGIHYAQVA